MARVSWLHLSDLKMGPRGSRLTLPEAREELERDLRYLHGRCGPWDFVFITGDLTETGRVREFALLDDTLKSLWSYLQGLGSNPILLTVPGNHDLLREEAAHGAEAAFKPYLTWFERWSKGERILGGAAVQRVRSERMPCDWSVRFTREDLSLGIIGLNSAWPGGLDGGSKGDLLPEQANGAVRTNAHLWCRENALSMLLTHHAPEVIASKDALARTNPRGRFLLHLCSAGAPHDAPPGLRTDVWSRVWAAPSLFGGWTKEAAVGYTAGVLELDGLEGGLRLFPRMARPHGRRFTLGPAPEVRTDDETITLPVTLIGAPIRGRFVSPGVSAAAPSSERPLAQFVAPDEEARPVPAITAGPTLDKLEARVSWLSFAPSGRALAVALSNGQLLTWEVESQKMLWGVEAHRTSVLDVAWSPDGARIATVSEYHVRFWDAQSGARLPDVEHEEGSIRCLSWSPGGRLAVGGEGVQVWASDAKFGTLVNGVYAISWSPDGNSLAFGGERGDVVTLHHGPRALEPGPILNAGGRATAVIDLAWQPGGASVLAVAEREGGIAVWALLGSPRQPIVRLEGHTDVVVSIAFSPDGRLLASKSFDGKVRLFRTDTWQPVATLDEPMSRQSFAGLAFAPAPAVGPASQAVLATLEPGELGVRLWRVDVDALLESATARAAVESVSAKVVLVGEGRAGKSCIALRMVKDEYAELGSTHGIRFWPVPAERLGAAPARQNRQVVLWDLGGQAEYRLVHQLFLPETTVALLALEPGRGQPALEEMEGWLRLLPPELAGGQPVRKILVGTKVDDQHAPVDLPAIEALVRRESLDGYVSTSARTGRGVPELKALLLRSIDWAALGRTSQPKLFQRIQKHIQTLIASRRVVLPYGDLERELRGEHGDAFDPEAVRAVVAQLAKQGALADTRMADGSRALILDVERVERYAASLIIAARENRSGLPALDLGAVLAARAPLPRMEAADRLPRDQEMVVLDSVIELLIERGLCMRHQGLLIFPSLFPPAQPDPAARRDVALVYSFTGEVSSIYASLVSALAQGKAFGRMRLWEDRAEFGRASDDSCGVRKVGPQQSRGVARLEIYFDPGTSEELRALFLNVVDDHLREEAVEIVEQIAVTCICGVVFAADVIRKRVAAGHLDVVCPVCEVRAPFAMGAEPAREKNPALIARVRALKMDMRAERQRTVVETKATLNEVAKQSANDVPLRVLHLSDLHLGTGADAESLLQPLLADLRDSRDGLGVDRLDYLVVSGDVTNRASSAEFERAHQFLSHLIEEMGLTGQRCVLVPGNHDLDWDTDVYTFKKKRVVSPAALADGSYVEEANGYQLRDDARYTERFRNFSASLYHPLLQCEYPLPPDEQCIPHTFSEHGLQVLAMNSAWEIDEYFRSRSSINERALSRGLNRADQQRDAERAAGKLPPGRDLLRIAVWHHPVTGNEKILADAFLARLRQAGIRLCLHGHVHQDRTDVIGYLTPTQQIHVAGAGSFGAPTADRPESVPRLYNLLEIARDHSAVRVHTRCLRQQGGAWAPWAVWPSQQHGHKSSSYLIKL